MTLQVAVYPPSTVVTVIVALPAPTAETIPLETVATELLLEDQVTDLFSAYAAGSGVYLYGCGKR